MSRAVPPGWEPTTIGSIGRVVTGSTPSTLEKTYWGGEIPFISPADFDGSVYVKGTERSLSSIGASKSRVLPKDSVLVTCIGSLGGIAMAPSECATNQQINAVVLHEGNDARYCFYNILFNIDDLTKNAGGTTIPIINKSTFERINLLAPPFREQQKIAAILTSVDDVIESTQAQINKLKDLKSGMMQELLTKGIGHTEFKDSPVGRIPKVWDICKIADVLNVIESGWSPQCESWPAVSGEWGVLKTTAVSWNGFDFRANKALPIDLEPRPSIQVRVDDILVTRAGPLERVGVVTHVDSVPDKIMLSDKIIRITVNTRCHSKYLALWLSSNYVQGQFSLHVSGLAQSQTNISQEILRSPFIALPSLKEQRKISNAISAIESRIIFTEKKLDSLELSKKALMEDLLTGKVRVQVN